MPTFSNGENGLSVRTKINNAIDRVDGLQTTSSPAFAGLTVNGNITITGTVDGRDVSTDGTKLDGIEVGATADQTAAEIKTAYESNANTNAFTDAEQALVAGALQASNNLSDLTIPATALTNLGLTATATEINYTDGVTSAIQTQLDGKQPLDAGLTSIAGLTTAADRMIYTTASDTYAVTPLTSAGRAIIDDATAADQLVTLGLTATAAEINTLDGVTVTTAQINSIAQFTGRNLIINGSGRINQRGYVSGAATSGANQFTLDRWFVVTSGQNLAFTGDASARVMTAPAGGVSQVIEGANIVGGTYVLNWTGTATATVGGVARTKGETFTLTANTNVTVTFTSGTFSEVQLEAGSIVTPFERRSVGQELALCQRYYCVTFGNARFPATAGAQDVDTSVYWPVTMRAAPAAAQSGGNIANATPTLADITVYGLRLSIRSGAAGDSRVIGRTITADAELTS